MDPAGFCHFAALAPHMLALAAPDGRHWSRGELCLEVTRLARGLANRGVIPGDNLTISMDNSAEVISLGLAAQRLQCSLLALRADRSQPVVNIEGSKNITLPYTELLAVPSRLPESANDSDPLPGVEAARKLMAQLDIHPDSGHVHYCGAPLWRDDALARALAFLHFGHPVILEGNWSPDRMLHSLEQYQASSCQLDREQLEQLLGAYPAVPGQYQLSLSYLFCGDETADNRIRRQHWL